jgi:hypothetical protein
MPMKPNSRPVAARPKATGMPVSRKKNRPANISGTKFWAMNSAHVSWLRGFFAFFGFSASSSASCSSADFSASTLKGSLGWPRQEGRCA